MSDVLIIDGVDFSPFLLEGGVDVKRNDLESSSAGRTTMDGKMHRSRIAVKTTLQVSCRPMTFEDVQRLCRAIYPPFVTVTYWGPIDGMVTKTMYSNNVSVKLKRMEKDGTSLWDGLKFPLIEQ